MNTIKSSANNYFPALTGVRAIAAYMVYLHHYLPFGEEMKGSVVYDFFAEFHVGVTIFFVLSGFLIAYRYSDLTNFSFRKYMVNRFARIYPMYFIITTLAFLFDINLSLDFEFLKTPTLYLFNISFIKGFYSGHKFTGIPQGWSLTVEECFYIFAPLIFFCLRKSMNFLIIFPIILYSIGVCMVKISQILSTSFFGSYDFMFIYTFFGRCAEFFIGIILAVIFKKGNRRPSFKHFTYTGIFLMIFFIYLLSAIKGNNDTGIRLPLGKVINTFFLPLFGIATFFYGLLTEKTIVSRILETKLFVLLGKSSYIFYLAHMGIVSAIMWRFMPNFLFFFFPGYILGFLGLIVTSIVLFYCIEEPLNNFLRKKLA